MQGRLAVEGVGKQYVLVREKRNHMVANCFLSAASLFGVGWKGSPGRRGRASLRTRDPEVHTSKLHLTVLTPESTRTGDAPLLINQGFALRGQESSCLTGTWS